MLEIIVVKTIVYNITGTERENMLVRLKSIFSSCNLLAMQRGLKVSYPQMASFFEAVYDLNV